MNNVNNSKKVVIINDEFVAQLKQTKDCSARRKIIRNYLIDKMVGCTITKDYLDKQLQIKNTKTDVKHLTRNEHIDTTIALSSIENLIDCAEYLDEKMVDECKRKTSPNDYYWYFKVTVIIDDEIYKYILNFGKNKTDQHINLYDITNYKKKER